jgi:hypothetical protein
MKKTMILGFAVAGIFLSPLTVLAKSGNGQYPAAYFEPKVVFIDESSAQQPKRKVVQDSQYPAAYFEPKVVFIDPEAASSSSKPERKIVHDPKYPATYFEPKVVFP